MSVLSPIRPPERPPTVDEVDFKALYRKSEYEVETADGWTLNLIRYQPVSQPFEQPILGEPLLLVHGFSQNRHTWTVGELVKNLLFFGADIHVLELRGHGKSSLALQRRKHREAGTRLPEDLVYGWDIDSYFLEDIPAAVAAVKRRTGRDKIFYCGHSMGGMLGYGYAGLHDDLEGLVTIGSPSSLGSDFWPLKLAAYMEPVFSPGVDAALGLLNARARAGAGVLRGVRRVVSAVPGARGLVQRLPAPRHPRPLRFHYVPMDGFLRALSSERGYRTYEWMSRYLVLLSNPSRVTSEDIRWLLREGGEKEPRKVVAQFARWIRSGRMICYRTGYDFNRGFERIHIPMAIVFGDMDKLASVESTREVYRAARSEYLLWRPVKGNGHLELTMGHDIGQICCDVKNLVVYAQQQRTRLPSLPRRA